MCGGEGLARTSEAGKPERPLPAADALQNYTGGNLTVTGPKETASIFATYPAPYLSLNNGFLDQVGVSGDLGKPQSLPLSPGPPDSGQGVGSSLSLWHPHPSGLCWTKSEDMRRWPRVLGGKGQTDHPAAYGGPSASADSKVLGTGILIVGILAILDTRNKGVPAGLEPVAVGLLVLAIGLSLGANCGFPLNPARDLGPRLFTYVAGWGPEVFR